MAIDPNNRPVRVINDDTTNEELEAGHLIAGANPPKNEDARGGFGNREGKQGYGSDSSDGNTAVTVNEDADRLDHPADNMRTSEEGADQRPNQDLPAPDDIDPDRLPVRPAARGFEVDEMSNPNSRVGMGQMEQPQPRIGETGGPADLANTQTNAEQNDPNAQESGIFKGE